jgi:hypothetical protein
MLSSSAVMSSSGCIASHSLMVVLASIMLHSLNIPVRSRWYMRLANMASGANANFFYSADACSRKTLLNTRSSSVSGSKRALVSSSRSSLLAFSEIHNQNWD